MGVFSEAMRIPSLLAGLFFATSIAFGDDKQIITMDDGTKLTLLGTTYGTHHMAPGYENLRTANWINTASNTTVVWIQAEHKTSQVPILSCWFLTGRIRHVSISRRAIPAFMSNPAWTFIVSC